MAGVVATVTIALFLSGVVVGVFAVVALAVRREDRANTIVGDAPSPDAGECSPAHRTGPQRPGHRIPAPD